MMMLDFPNYSHSNPWQIKTIKTSAPIKVEHTNQLDGRQCDFLHISWEDILIRNCSNQKDALSKVQEFQSYLEWRKKNTKIIWTIHNETSHSEIDKVAEMALREVLAKASDLIFLMCDNHKYVISKQHQKKIKLLPHYIEENPYKAINKNISPTFFKYGLPRNETNSKWVEQILNDKTINCFVSDTRISQHSDTKERVVTNRRFTGLEADLYARLSNFSIFYRKPQFNSGALNFYIGNKLAVFHDQETMKFMELPSCYDPFCITRNLSSSEIVDILRANPLAENEELEIFIKERSPDNISTKFWQYVTDL